MDKIEEPVKSYFFLNRCEESLWCNDSVKPTGEKPLWNLPPWASVCSMQKCCWKNNLLHSLHISNIKFSSP